MGNTEACCNQSATVDDHTIKTSDRNIENQDLRPICRVSGVTELAETDHAETELDELNVLDYEQMVKMFAFE